LALSQSSILFFPSHFRIMIEASVVGPLQSELGPAGSHKAVLKKFLSVSELAPGHGSNAHPRSVPP
jgi:hypothetical protein